MKPSIEEGFRALIVEVIREEVRRAVNDAIRPDEFLSTSAAAKVAHVKSGTIRRWVSTGKLTGHRVGKRILRIDRGELERFLRKGASNDEMTPEQLADKIFG